MADKQMQARAEITGVSGICPISMGFKDSPCRAERSHGVVQIAGNQRDFRFGNATSGAGCRFMGTERAGSTSQQVFRASEIAKLRHSDATQGQRRRVIAQRNMLQRRQHISARQRAGGGRD
jgi:hypothetical protein